MRIPLLLSALLTAAACGGGGGGGGVVNLPATIRGSVLALSGVPQALAQREAGDAEPNDFAACLRLARSAPAGSLDAAHDPVDAFRFVAAAPGRVTVELETDGVEAEAMLHDLATGQVARTLDVAAGTVYDVVVSATGGAGSYRALLGAGGGDFAPRTLPERYCSCGDGFVPGEIVVGTAAGVTPEALAEATGLECLGGVDELCLFRAPVPADADEFRAMCDLLVRCARLEADGLVHYAEPNLRRRLAQTPNDTLFADQWNMLQVRAPQAWDEITASTIIMAFVDSGIRPHPDVVDKLVPGHDFVDNDDDPFDPNPSFAHGTQTAGVAAAAGNDGRGVAGMVWDGRIMALRAFDVSGFGNAFDIANAIRYAVGLSSLAGDVPQTPALVINLSFASQIPTTAEQNACVAAKAEGATLFAAAGNDGNEDERYPAAYDSTVAVTATSQSRGVTGYSNSGSWVDMCAPGGTTLNGVRVPGINSQNQSLTWVFVNGTSFACPHAVGIAALMLAIDPTLTPDEIEQILKSTAQDIEAPGFDNLAGAGIVDAFAAVSAALGRDPPLQPGEQVVVRLTQETPLAGQVVVLTQVTSDATLFAFEFGNVAAGDYTIVAGTDRDGDGDVTEAGEVSGSVDLTVAAGEVREDVSVVIRPQ